MNLTEEQVKAIVEKTHEDLLLPYNNIYPIYVRFYEKDNPDNDLNKPMWIGSYDYSKFKEVNADYVEVGITYFIDIDDEKGEAIQYSHYTGRWKISLNVNGKYERVKQLGRGDL